MNRAEKGELIDELAWWQVLADLLGWQVLGWTHKYGATFVCEGDTIQMTGAQRDATVARVQALRQGPFHNNEGTVN